MKALSERLSHALQLTGVTQSELARRIGIKQQSISQICSGKSARSRYTMQVAEALRVNAHWFATGDGEIGLGVGNVEVGPDIKGRIPLINWVQAGDWTEIAEGFAHEDAEEWREVTGKAHPIPCNTDQRQLHHHRCSTTSYHRFLVAKEFMV